MLNVRVNFEQLGMMMKDVEKFREIINDSAWIYRRLSDLVRAAFKKQIDSEGDFFGDRWPPLASSTIIEKKYSGYPLKPLRRTNKFYKALTDETSAHRTIKATDRGLYFALKDQHFRDDFGLVYPIVHEEGTDTVPARPVFSALRKSKKFKEKTAELLLKSIQKKLASLA